MFAFLGEYKVKLYTVHFTVHVQALYLVPKR